MELYENREELDAVAQACYERATDEAFNWDTVAAQFDDAFQEVLEEVAVTEEKPKKKGKGRKAEKALVPA